MPKKKAKNRQGVGEEIDDKISSRNVLKIAAAAGAVSVLSPSMSTSKEAPGFQTIAEPVICVTPVNSPPGHPFVDNFTAPFRADDHPLNPQTTEIHNLGAGKADREPHPRWARFTVAHFTNVSGSAWDHPVHKQFAEFRTLNRFVNGAEVPVSPLMTGRKDVSRLAGGHTLLITMQCRVYNGRCLICSHDVAHAVIQNNRNLKDRVSKDFFLYSVDWVTNSPGPLLRQTGQGGHAHDQNSV